LELHPDAAALNWLAHLVLSDPTPEFRVGNLLPDLVRLDGSFPLSLQMQAGVARHRLIDAYTDAHPVTFRSAGRFSGGLRRYGRVLTDIFYDHFLVRAWPDYSSEPLPAFLAGFYGGLDATITGLPRQAQVRLRQIRQHDWMGTYGELAGIQHVLQCMQGRLRRPAPLADGIQVLHAQYEAFQKDFEEFFPQLCHSTAPDLHFPLMA
jgi:acyl carrier protein phosphodiesterase